MVKIEYVDYNDLEAPPILYKYRDWSNTYHKKSLIDPSVYLSAPSGFEDILDCKTPVRYDFPSLTVKFFINQIIRHISTLF